VAAKRDRAGAKKLDLSVLRAALADGRVWSGMGVVRKFPGETAHYEILTGTGAVDVLVDVELAPNGERLVCRLGGAGGVWRIPGEGTEVAIIVPEGDFDADAIIVAELATGAEIPGLEPGITVITNSTGVHVRDSQEEPVSLALKADVEALKATVAALVTKYNGHTHVTSCGSGAGSAAAPTVTQTAPADPTGTFFLKGH
jgi:hypothetical protein